MNAPREWMSLLLRSSPSEFTTGEVTAFYLLLFLAGTMLTLVSLL
ncbi:hypothetical protein [Nibribacter ruber]|nr:hypothetical protein [Nibribacter ruber]